LEKVTSKTPLGTTVKYIGRYINYKDKFGKIIINGGRVVVDFGETYKFDFRRYIEFNNKPKIRKIGQYSHYQLNVDDLRII